MLRYVIAYLVGVLLFVALYPLVGAVVMIPAVVLLVLLVLAAFLWSPVDEYRAYRARRLAAQAALSPVPVDDGPLDYDGHTVPTAAEMRGYSFGDEMLAPVRERVA